MNKPRSLKTSELVAREIVRRISDRQLRPGDVLESEAAMLQELGVGRASLREALRLLEVQGLVNIRQGPKGGPEVGTVDPARLGQTLSLFLRMAGATYNDLNEFMMVVYPKLAELAALRSTPEEAEAALMPCIAEHDCSFSDPVARRKAERHANTFHPAVNRLSGNPVLALFASAVGSIITEHILASINTSEMVEQASGEHIAIARAIIDGDGAAARDEMTSHMQNMLDLYRRHVPGMLDQKVEWR
ncbi:MAG: FCD domain-containing protein [Alphaproteobacteria bacterium]|nr:FCD domain-containing protein [Alphaproteobacteria bacterium]